MIFHGATHTKNVLNVLVIAIVMKLTGENDQIFVNSLSDIGLSYNFQGINISIFTLFLHNIFSNKTAFTSDETETNYKCINKICVYQNSPKKSASLKPGEIPSEYVKAGPRSTDYYYVSEDSLPWPQAQYECQSRSGRLAELGQIDTIYVMYYLT